MNTTSIWEQMATRYDIPDRVNTAKIIVEAVRGELKDTKEKTALDYGCGTGLVGLGLTDLFQSVLLADPSAQMVEQVNRKIEQGNFQGASTLCCNFLEQVPHQLTTDYIILSQVLLHIKDTRSILTKLYQVLKENGHLILVDFDKNPAISSEQIHNGFDQKELAELLKEIGFTAVDSHTFHHGQNLLMNQPASYFILNAKK